MKTFFNIFYAGCCHAVTGATNTPKRRKGAFILLLAAFSGWSGLWAQQTIGINSEHTLQWQDETPDAIADGAVQYRRFEINPRLKNFSQDNAGDTLLLDFFDNHRYMAVVQHVTRSYDGIIGITARIADAQWAYCFISISEGSVSVAAELPGADTYFSVRHADGNDYLVEQKLSEALREHGGECVHEAPPTVDSGPPARIGPNGIAPRSITPSLPPSDVAVTVDVLALYTSAAKVRASQGGGIDNMINQAIQQANLVMLKSQTNVTFNVVYKQEINYTESTSSLNNDLVRLRNSDDGYMDEAHALRSRYSADLVMLVVDNAVASNVTGVGYVLNDDTYGGNPSSGFSVVKVIGIASGYTLIHELGHNFGCGHHLDVDSEGIYSYSHGWRGVTTQSSRFSTVMTYENTTGINYPRIPYFSDPTMMVDGTAIGDATRADNARTIRQTKVLIGGYSDEVLYTDAFLRDITLSSGTLAPAFNPGIKNYTVTVGNGVSSMDVTGVANSSYAVVSGNVTGKALVVGDNRVDITVVDGWQNNTKVYTVTVTRQNVLPQPPAVTFPTAAAVTYNPAQKLRDIALTGGSGDGAFAWATPDATPVVANSGYEVVFTPRDAVNYDYSGIALRRTVQLTVNKAGQVITFPAIPDKKPGDAPFNVNATVNTGLPLTYGNSNSVVADISANGTVTVKDAGVATITVRQAGNENYLEAVADRTFSVQPLTSTGDVETGGSDVLLYPNPVNRSAPVSIRTNGMQGHITVEVYRPSGDLVQQTHLEDGRSDIQAPDSPGVYLYVLKIKGKKLGVRKVVVQ